MQLVRLLMVMVMLASAPLVQIQAFAAEPAGKAKIEQLQAFSEGMAGIAVQGKWGFINDDGKTVVEPVFHDIRPFQNGYAPVKLVTKWGIIDKKGHYVINPGYDAIGSLAEDLIAVKAAGKWGYITLKDKMAIPAQFTEAQSFSQGLAAVRIDSNWGFIDSDGRFVVNPRFAGAGSFSDGLAPVQVGSQWGFIDKKGNLKIKPQFQNATSFSNDLAAVQEDSLWGFINDDGRFEINPQYNDVSAFSEGLAPVQKDGTWGYINLKGKLVIPYQYKEAGRFSNGIARVVSGGTVSYITPKGKDAGVGVSATLASVSPPPAKPAPQLPRTAQSAPVVVTPAAVTAGKIPKKVALKKTQASSATKPLKTDTPAADPATIEPLGTLWQNAILPKQRPIIAFMDPDQNITTFRGTEAFFAYNDGSLKDGQTGYTDSNGKQVIVTHPENLDAYYQKDPNLLTTSNAKLNLKGSSSRVFSIAQAAGVVPQTVTTVTPVLGAGTNVFDNVPIGMISSSYLTKDDENGTTTHLWMELAGRSPTKGTESVDGSTPVAKLNPVQLETDVNGKALPRPYFKYLYYKTTYNQGAGTIVDSTALSMGLAHDMVAWDWDNDGYTDYLVSYVTNPTGENDYKSMKVALVFIDGKSLYSASQGSGKVRFWVDTSSEYTNGDAIFLGTADMDPPNSVRLSIGDLDNDNQPEVALYFTKLCHPKGDQAHNNTLRILKLAYKNPDPDTGKTTNTTPNWNWIITEESGYGRWYIQSDSVAMAIGDLDGDGLKELVLLHGNTEQLNKTSRVYLDIYNLNTTRTCKGNNNTDCTDNYTLDHPVSGSDNDPIAQTSKMPDGNKSNPVLQASIADLNGDGTAELVWIGTTEDDPTKLQLYIRSWKHYVAPAPSDTPTTRTGKDNPLKGNMGTEHPSYQLSKYFNGTLDPTYIRYAMTTGFFVYPETTGTSGSVNRFSQIALVTTSKGTVDGTVGLQWGVFSWGCSSSGCALTRLGSGKQDNLAKGINVGPSIVAADLDGDSMIIGQGVKVTVTDSTETFYNIQAPPKHYDEFTYNGINYTMDAFSTLENYKTSIHYTQESTNVTSTTSISQGKYDLTAGYSRLNSEKIGNNVPPPFVSAGVQESADFVNDSREENSKTLGFEILSNCDNADSIVYRSNTHDLWRYPILYPPAVASQTVAVVDPTTNQTSQVKTQSYIQFVVPQVLGDYVSAWGTDVIWYQPRHNNLNLFSYPAQLKDILGYPQGATSKAPENWWKNINGTSLAGPTTKIIGNLNDDALVFTLQSDSSKEQKKNYQMTIGGYLNLTPAFGKNEFDFDASGDGSFGTDSVTTSDTSNLMQITVNTPGVGNYIGQSEPNVPAAQQNFTIDSSVYTTDSGVYSLGFAVTSLKNNSSSIWGGNSPYLKAADPALNLPRMYTTVDGKMVPNSLIDSGTGLDTSNSHEIRGIQFNDAKTFNVSTSLNGQAIPVNTQVSSTIRIYNYSFVTTDKVTVTLKFQPIDNTDVPPDVTQAGQLATSPVGSIPGRDSGGNNWTDLTIKWTTPSQPTYGYFHVVLETPNTIDAATGKAILRRDSDGKAVYGGGNLNLNNDQGYLLVGIYNPQSTITADTQSAESATAPVKTNVSSRKNLKVVTDSLSVRPIRNRTLGASTSTLASGQEAIIQAQVRFDDTRNDKSIAIKKVHVYLRDGRRVIGHTLLPLLFNGKGYTVRMPYKAPKNPQSVLLEMVVTSAALPLAADSSPRARLANKVLTISQP